MLFLALVVALPTGRVPTARAATWSSENPIISRQGVDVEPSLIKLKVGAQAGNLAMAWVSNRPGTNDIYFLINKAGSWQAPAGVNATGWVGDAMGGNGPLYDDSYPSILELANGSIMIFWAQCPPSPDPSCSIVYNTYSFTAHPSGSHWSEFVVLENGSPGGIFNTGPSATVTPAGLLCVFWHSNRLAGPSDTVADFDIYYTCSSDYGVNWNPDSRMPGSVDSIDDHFPNAVSTSDGTIWLAWNSYHDSVCCSVDSEIYLASFKTGVWSSTIQLTSDPGQDTAPALTITKDGGFWLFWESNRDSSTCLDINVYSKRSYDPSNLPSWSTDLKLTSDPCKDRHPSAYEVQSGVIGVAWSSNRDTTTYPYDIFYATLTFHNLKVASVTPTPSSVQPGGKVTIAVVIHNGGFQESFTLNLSANSTLLTSIPQTCGASLDCSISYSWSTVGWSVGRYIIHAQVTQVPLEENTNDNTKDSPPVTVGIREVGMSSLAIPAYIYRGQTIKVNVTVTNSGQVVEDFTLALTYNDTRTVGTAAVSALGPGSTRTLSITWNTTTYSPGGCKLTATVPVLPTENNPGDNTLSKTYSYASCIRKTGDVTGDKAVSIDDLIATYLHLFTQDPQSIPIYDIDGDHDVDIDDLILVFLNQFV